MRRIDGLGPRLLAVSLDAGCAIVVGTARGARGVGLLGRAPRGSVTNALMHALRVHLGNATLTDARREGACLLLDFTGEQGPATLACVFDGAMGALVLCDAGARVLQSSTPEAHPVGAVFEPPEARRPLLLANTLDALEAAGAALLASHAAAEVEARRRAVTQAIHRAHARAERRLAAIAKDLSASAEAATLRHRASLVLACAHATPRDAAEMRVLDESGDPPAEHIVALAPQPGGVTGPRAAVAAAEALFTRARKFDTAARIAADRRDATTRALSALATLMARAEAMPDIGALRVLSEEAHALGVPGARAALSGPADAPAARRRAAPPPRVPYRRFLSADGRAILVGKGAADNDALTLRHARPQDLWLHARGVPGAHVVVPLAKGETCPPALALDAATLAAHFSDVRGETVVDVQQVARRHVRKPRGASPGAVTVERERVIALRVESARLTRLLQAETLVDGTDVETRPRRTR